LDNQSNKKEDKMAAENAENEIHKSIEQEILKILSWLPPDATISEVREKLILRFPNFSIPKINLKRDGPDGAILNIGLAIICSGVGKMDFDILINK